MRFLVWSCPLFMCAVSGCSNTAEQERARAEAEVVTLRAELAKARVTAPTKEHKPSVIIGEGTRVSCRPGGASVDLYPIQIVRVKTITFDLWLIKDGKKEKIAWFSNDWKAWPADHGPIDGQCLISFIPTGKARLKISAGVGFASTPFRRDGIDNAHIDPEFDSFAPQHSTIYPGPILASQIRVIRVTSFGELTSKVEHSDLESIVKATEKHEGIPVVVLTALWKPAD